MVGELLDSSWIVWGSCFLWILGGMYTASSFFFLALGNLLLVREKTRFLLFADFRQVLCLGVRPFLVILPNKTRPLISLVYSYPLPLQSFGDNIDSSCKETIKTFYLGIWQCVANIVRQESLLVSADITLVGYECVIRRNSAYRETRRAPGPQSLLMVQSCCLLCSSGGTGVPLRSARSVRCCQPAQSSLVVAEFIRGASDYLR